MTTKARASRLPPGADIALGFLAGAGTFALTAVVVADVDSDLVVLILAAPYVVAVVGIARLWSIAYAVPVAMAGLLAYDWYYLPPTHPLEFPDRANLVDLIVYLAVAVLVGQLAAHAARRAESSERAFRAVADEQAALRRVATLVARGVPASEVFAAVAREVGRLLDVTSTHMARFDPRGTATGVGSWAAEAAHLPVGTRMSLDDTTVTGLVFRTGRPARKDTYDDASGNAASLVRELGIRSSVGAPIVVEGRLWGVLVASSGGGRALPADAEPRIAEFTELVATAISNLEARSDLAASRARIVEATDHTRRRFERDLHDGVQQRLVSVALEVREAEAMTGPSQGELRARLSQATDALTGALDELRELSQGIHPAILSEGGLGPALRALARRSAVPTRLDVKVGERLDERVEVAGYYVVSEALANAAKHAQASVAQVRVEAREGTLELEVRDDGLGGADPARGSGLIGLRDRVEALGGTIAIVSPAGEGTSLHVELPLAILSSR